MLATSPLGTTGMEITRVGFGAWAIGGGDWSFGWGAQDDAQSIAAIRHAVEAGINWIDTAAVYGLGHSEEVVAEALAPFSEAERPYVFTKCGLVWDPVDRMAPARRVGAPTSIRRELEGSLRRLRREQIDLYQMHRPPEDGTPVDAYWTALLELKAEGKVAAVGLSNHSVQQVAAAAAFGHVDSVQPPLSLIVRDAARELIPWCQEQHTGVIVYSPMQAGLLSGAFTQARAEALEAGDWRRSNPQFTGGALHRNLALADALRPIAERHGTTPAAVAIAWTLAWPGVSGAIVGARRPDQVDGWLGAAELRLSEADLDDLSAAIVDIGAGSGPTRPEVAGTGAEAGI